MYKLKDETNIDEIVKKISENSNITKSDNEEMFVFKASSGLSDYLGVNFSELDAVLHGEPNFTFFETLGLTQADLDNLISEYGRSIIIGILLGILLHKK